MILLVDAMRTQITFIPLRTTIIGHTERMYSYIFRNNHSLAFSCRWECGRKQQSCKLYTLGSMQQLIQACWYSLFS